MTNPLTIETLARALCEQAKQPADIGWRAWSPYARTLLNAINAAGWKVVPVEATEGMTDAISVVYARSLHTYVASEDEFWSAMLAAAPEIGEG